MKTIIAVTYFNIGVDVLGFVKHWIHEHSVIIKDKRKTSGNLYKPKSKTDFMFNIIQFEL